MAIGNINLGMIISGAVGASFAKAVSSASSKVEEFKQRAEKARGFQALIQDTIRLRSELSKTVFTGGDAFNKLKAKHDENISKLKSHGIAVDKLDKEYAKLGKTIKGLELGAAGRLQAGEGWQNVKDSGKTVGAVVGTATIPTMASATYQSIIRDMAIKGGIARTDKETDLSQSIRRDAKDSGIDRNELAQAVNALVAGGMEVEKAAGMAKTMARFSVSQNAESGDVAKMILALRQAGIVDPAAMEKALGKVAVAGDLGSFEAKDMAKHFGNLVPQMTAFGMAGEHATVALANMLQTQMKAAGSADEAANNLANLLGKITADDTKKKFADNGFDFEGSMQAAIAKGYDPVSAFIGLIQEATKETDPAKAKEMAALQEKIAQAQDPAAAQKMLDGYLEMAGLSEYISDREAKQAALAAIQNKRDHADNLKKIKDADGEAKIEKDLADRRAASMNKWREAAQAFDDALVSVGDAIRPATDAVADLLSSVGGAIASVAQKAPGASMAVLGVASGFAAFMALKGTGQMIGGAFKILRGAWLAKGGKGLSGVGGKGAAGAVMDALSGGAGVQRVFVVNMPGSGFGGGPDLPSGADGGKPGTKPPSGKPQGRLAAMKAGATGLLGKVAPYAGKIGGGLAVAGAAYSAVDTFRNAKTDQEKAEGYGGAAGGLAGGLAGAKAGAVFGALAGPVGIAIGGIAGGVLGSILGDKAGSWLGGKIAEPKPAAPAEVAKAAAQALSAPKLAAEKPAAAPQQLTFSPTIQVTVQGDVKDPRQLANELMPHLRRMFEQFQSQSARGAMFDPAHA